MKLTEYGHSASVEMLKVMAISTNIHWDMETVDRDFSKDGNPNEEYNRYAKEYVAQRAVVSIVDAYQWYNIQIFKLLARKAPQAFKEFSEGVNLSSIDLKRIANGEDPIVVSAEKLSLRDSTVRKHLHKTLDLWEENEMSILVEMRNCISHHLGKDHRGVVAEWIRSGNSPWKLKEEVTVIDGIIVLSGGIHIIAAQIGQAQISIFDQMVAATFGLDVKEGAFPPLKRSKRG